MVRFLVYVVGEFVQLKQTLCMLVELAGLHINSRSGLECLKPDPSPSHFSLDESDEKPEILSITAHSWQPRSPPGQHSRSSLPYSFILQQGSYPCNGQLFTTLFLSR